MSQRDPHLHSTCCVQSCHPISRFNASIRRQHDSSTSTQIRKRTWNTLALGWWAIASSRSRFLTVWAFQNYTKKKTRCLLSLVAHATSVATSVTTPRSALRLSVFATTASSQATSPTTARTLALLRVCRTIGQRMHTDDTDLSHRQTVLPLPGSRTRAG